MCILYLYIVPTTYTLLTMPPISSILYSLSYHLGFCADRLSAAFKYDILAADLSLSRSVYTDMILFVRHAQEHARNLSEFRMLLRVVDCASEDVLAVCNENNRHKSKGIVNERRSSFSLFASKISFLEPDDQEDSLSVSVSTTHVDSFKTIYTELKQIREKVEEYIENCHSVKPTNSTSIDVSLYMPPPKLNWFPDYVEAKDNAKKQHKNNQMNNNNSILSRFKNFKGANGNRRRDSQTNNMNNISNIAEEYQSNDGDKLNQFLFK